MVSAVSFAVSRCCLTDASCRLWRDRMALAISGIASSSRAYTMHGNCTGPRIAFHATVCAAAVGIAAGCAKPAFVASAPITSAVEHTAGIEMNDVALIAEPQTFEVRQPMRSPTIVIVAYAPEETAYGCARCCDAMVHQISRTAYT